MLSIKIGSTYATIPADIDIPVVMYSPIFLTDDNKIPGSFIFNFTLPLTDELKNELSFPHRPQRKGKITVGKPAEISFGVLRFAGTANIELANSTQVEVSMPVNNGNLAKSIKKKSIKDIGLDEIIPFDPKISICQLANTITDHLEMNFDGQFLNQTKIVLDTVRIDPYNMYNAANGTWTIPEITQSFQIRFVVNLQVWGADRFILIYINNVPAHTIDIPIGEGEDSFRIMAVNTSRTYELEAGDTLFFMLCARSLPAAGNMQSVTTNIISGTTIAFVNEDTPFQSIPAKNYPDSNYAVFPIYNPSALNNISDNLYQIEFNDIKQNHEEFAPYLNYFVDDKFPWVVTGLKNSVAYAMINLFAPYPYIAAIIKAIFNTIGYTIVNNVFETENFKQAVMVHNNIINNYFYQSGQIKLNDFIPDIPIADFLRDVCSQLGVTFAINSVTKTITFELIDNIMADKTKVPFHLDLITKPELDVINYSGMSISYEKVSCDYIEKYVKSLENINIKGTVTNIGALGGIQNPEINDAYYVTTRHAFYCWNYDNELSILNWIIYSFDFPMEMNDIDADSEFDPYSLTLKINTILMNFWHPVKGRGDLTISNLGRGWITPAWITPCNFTLLPEDLQSDPQYTLLFYRGLVNDYNDDKFPLASNDVYDYDGNIIAALALRLDTDYGVYNKLLRNFIDFVLNSPGDYTFFKKMSVAEIATLNLFKWHNAFETDWLIKEIRFNIKYDTISTAQIIACRRYIADN